MLVRLLLTIVGPPPPSSTGSRITFPTVILSSCCLLVSSLVPAIWRVVLQQATRKKVTFHPISRSTFFRLHQHTSTARARGMLWYVDVEWYEYQPKIVSTKGRIIHDSVCTTVTVPHVRNGNKEKWDLSQNVISLVQKAR